MDSKQLAKKLQISPSTLSEWKSLIKKETGVVFATQKISAGFYKGSRRAKAHRKVYSCTDFTLEDVKRFEELKMLLSQKVGRLKAIREVFGNDFDENDETAQMRQKIKTLESLCDEQDEEYETLWQKFNTIQDLYKELVQSNQELQDKNGMLQAENSALDKELDELKSRKLTARLFNR
ncbi:hypothetical protein VNN41_05655 [Lactococcus garvieae]|uniref:hypothetical protein n=1 Tax=Lactococcus garvieae TaxID=1363 RepID=UPI00324892DF